MQLTEDNLHLPWIQKAVDDALPRTYEELHPALLTAQPEDFTPMLGHNLVLKPTNVSPRLHPSARVPAIFLIFLFAGLGATGPDVGGLAGTGGAAKVNLPHFPSATRHPGAGIQVQTQFEHTRVMQA